ncbi:hypothetical protein QWZ13_08445 [Reinekea marina]|nr:hypothetical protein [Reinekea marina]MDN3648939.1 hypothetical protein [Reinekea marina]
MPAAQNTTQSLVSYRKFVIMPQIRLEPCHGEPFISEKHRFYL